MDRNSYSGQNITDLVSRVLSEKDEWTKHLAHSCCKCQKCTCGKHKCKLEPHKINLQPSSSTYKHSYQRPGSADIKNQRLKAPTLDFHPHQLVQKSQYREQYYRKKNKGAKPEKGIAMANNIELGGPTFNLTTYDSCFTPKNSPPPQKIKNPQNLGSSNMRMNATSSYANTFKWNNRKPQAREAPIIRSNNLKTQPHPFVGHSVYNHDFTSVVKAKLGQKQSFAPIRKYESSRGLQPKSSYQTDFTQKKTSICPAAHCC